MSDVADVLEKAADLIETNGWTQDVYARGKSGREVGHAKTARCFCAAGAINVAAGNDPAVDANKPQEALAKAIGCKHVFGILNWNDDPGRTQEEVVAKLREAAAIAREQDA